MQRSIESQKSVIALLLRSPELYPEFVSLRPEMFVSQPQPFAKIFEVVTTLIKTGVTPTITKVAQQCGISEDYVAKFQNVPAVDAPNTYVAAIKAVYNKVLQHSFVQKVQGAADPIQEVRDVLAEFQDKLEHNIPVSHISTIVDRYLARTQYRVDNGITDHVLGLPWATLSAKMNGLYIGDYSIVGARPGMGKTSFMRQLRNHIMRVEKRSAVSFLLEMTTDKLLERMIAAELGVPYSSLRDLSVFKNEALTVQFYHIANSIRGLNWYLYGSQHNTVEAIEAIVQRHITDDNTVSFLDIDHIGKLYSKRRAENRTQELAYISNVLRGFSTRDWLGTGSEQLHVNAVVQLNRSVEDRDDKRPRISDIKQTGGIEEDADTVILLYRDAYYYPETTKPDEAEIIVGKNRNGAAGYVVPLRWDGLTMSFYDMGTSGNELY